MISQLVHEIVGTVQDLSTVYNALSSAVSPKKQSQPKKQGHSPDEIPPYALEAIVIGPMNREIAAVRAVSNTLGGIKGWRFHANGEISRLIDYIEKSKRGAYAVLQLPDQRRAYGILQRLRSLRTNEEWITFAEASKDVVQRKLSILPPRKKEKRETIRDLEARMATVRDDPIRKYITHNRGSEVEMVLCNNGNTKFALYDIGLLDGESLGKDKGTFLVFGMSRDDYEKIKPGRLRKPDIMLRLRSGEEMTDRVKARLYGIKQGNARRSEIVRSRNGNNNGRNKGRQQFVSVVVDLGTLESRLNNRNVTTEGSKPVEVSDARFKVLGIYKRNEHNRYEKTGLDCSLELMSLERVYGKLPKQGEPMLSDNDDLAMFFEINFPKRDGKDKYSGLNGYAGKTYEIQAKVSYEGMKRGYHCFKVKKVVTVLELSDEGTKEEVKTRHIKEDILGSIKVYYDVLHRDRIKGVNGCQKRY